MIINALNLFAIIIYHLLKIPSINELKKKTEENINYNFYIFIWVIISLRLIELSGPEISFLYLINHINLIFFINFYILNDRNNNIFKIIVIFLLLIDSLLLDFRKEVYCILLSFLSFLFFNKVLLAFP